MIQTQDRAHSMMKKLAFSVELDWLEKAKGKLRAPDVDKKMIVATPPAFGGEGRDWSPEHLFLGAVSSCYMSTFIVFAQKLQFHFSKLECEVSGIVEFVEGCYQFTIVEVHPKIYVDQIWEEKAVKTMEKAEKHCLISNSIKCPVHYFGKIIVV